jgi:hypothetical protein
VRDIACGFVEDRGIYSHRAPGTRPSLPASRIWEELCYGVTRYAIPR